MRLRFLLACAAALVPAVASARVAAPPPPVIRLATSDVTVHGKVTAFDDGMIDAEMYKGDTQKMQVVTFDVAGTLVGKTATKKIKVGFVPPAGRRPGVRLEKTTEGVLFLTKHPTKKDLYVVAGWGGLIEKTDDSYKATLEELAAAGKLMTNPTAGLASKDADERFATAALLVKRFRTHREGAKETPVPAELSKKILTVLAERDFKAIHPKYGYHIQPQAVFGMLGAEGFKPTGADFAAEAKEWLKANAGTFKMKSYLPAEKGSEVEP